MTWLAAVAMAAVLVGAGLVAVRAPLTRGTVVATVPWAVAGAILARLAATEAYGPETAVLEPPTVALTVACLAGATWLFSLQLAALRGVDRRARYLGVAGLGAATVLVVPVASGAGGTTLVDLAAVLVVPVAALVAAATGYYLLGLAYPDAVLTLRLAGLALVGAVVFDVLATAVAVATVGDRGPWSLSRPLVVTAFGAGEHVAGALVAASVLVGLLAAFACTRAARWRRPVGYGASLVVVAVCTAGGTYALLGVALP